MRRRLLKAAGSHFPSLLSRCLPDFGGPPFPHRRGEAGRCVLPVLAGSGDELSLLGPKVSLALELSPAPPDVCVSEPCQPVSLPRSLFLQSRGRRCRRPSWEGEWAGVWTPSSSGNGQARLRPGWGPLRERRPPCAVSGGRRWGTLPLGPESSPDLSCCLLFSSRGETVLAQTPSTQSLSGRGPQAPRRPRAAHPAVPTDSSDPARPPRSSGNTPDQTPPPWSGHRGALWPAPECARTPRPELRADAPRGAGRRGRSTGRPCGQDKCETLEQGSVWGDSKQPEALWAKPLTRGAVRGPAGGCYALSGDRGAFAAVQARLGRGADGKTLTSPWFVVRSRPRPPGPIAFPTCSTRSSPCAR